VNFAMTAFCVYSERKIASPNRKHTAMHIEICIITKVNFEWDIDKAAENEVKHGVTFDEAQEVFRDAYAIEFYDELHSDFEDRFRLLGMSSRQVLLVIYTERENDVLRIISARKATTNEKKQYEAQK
jgi:uncharacterized DUF497 family protein